MSVPDVVTQFPILTCSHVLTADIENTRRCEGKMEKDEGVSRAEFEELQAELRQVRSILSNIRKDVQPRDMEHSHKDVRVHGKSGEDYYCEDCETYTRNPFEHLKKNPEKHGLVKVVEREVKVPRSRHKTAAEYMDCPNCYPAVEKELLKRGWKPPKEKSDVLPDLLP